MNAGIIITTTTTTTITTTTTVERSGSGVELRTLDYENPGSNPVLWCKFFHSMLLQFTQLYK